MKQSFYSLGFFSLYSFFSLFPLFSFFSALECFADFLDIKGVTGVGSCLTFSSSFLARSFVVTGSLVVIGAGESYTADAVKYVKMWKR